MENKTTCTEVFGKRLKELRKANGYTIEQFAQRVGIAKSTVGYYENDNRLPDIEILARIANEFNVSADYLIGRTNTTALKGKMKNVCELTGLSDTAAEYLAKLVKNKDSRKLSVINHLFARLNEDYDFFCHDTQGEGDDASSILGALFIYFEKYGDFDKELSYFVLGSFDEDMLREAYRQHLLNQITDVVKDEVKAYMEIF